MPLRCCAACLPPLIYMLPPCCCLRCHALRRCCLPLLRCRDAAYFADFFFTPRLHDMLLLPFSRYALCCLRVAAFFRHIAAISLPLLCQRRHALFAVSLRHAATRRACRDAISAAMLFSPLICRLRATLLFRACHYGYAFSLLLRLLLRFIYALIFAV